jgi:hypothetical protein
MSPSPTFVLLTGPRRIGKTSLALHVADDLEADEQPHVLRVDLRGERQASSERVLRIIARVLRQLGGLDRACEDPRGEIAELVRRSEKPIVLILDEFAAVLESYTRGHLGDGLLAWIREGMETPLGCDSDGHSFAADRLRLLAASPPEGFALLGQQAINEHLGRLSVEHLWTIERPAATEMAVRPFREAGVHVQRRAAEQLTLLTACHPYILIVFLESLAERVNARTNRTEVTVSDIVKTTDHMLRSHSCFRDAVNEPGSSPNLHACLRAVANAQRTEQTPVARAEIIQQAGLAPADADSALERLVAYRVLERVVSASSAPRYDFTIPLIRAWVQRNKYANLGPIPVAEQWSCL